MDQSQSHLISPTPEHLVAMLRQLHQAGHDLTAVKETVDQIEADKAAAKQTAAKEAAETTNQRIVYALKDMVGRLKQMRAKPRTLMIAYSAYGQLCFSHAVEYPSGAINVQGRYGLLGSADYESMQKLRNSLDMPHYIEYDDA